MNYFSPMDLSDDENVSKRELRQVVDAFEYYAMEYSGAVIFSINTVGDYFYLLMEGSVRYYEHYTSTAISNVWQKHNNQTDYNKFKGGGDDGGSIK